MVTFLVQRRLMPRNSEFNKRALRGYKKLEEEKERGKGRGKKVFFAILQSPSAVKTKIKLAPNYHKIASSQGEFYMHWEIANHSQSSQTLG